MSKYDPEELTKLYEKLNKFVVFKARQHCTPALWRSHGEDLIQECWLQILLRYDRYDHKHALTTWAAYQVMAATTQIKAQAYDLTTWQLQLYPRLRRAADRIETETGKNIKQMSAEELHEQPELARESLTRIQNTLARVQLSRYALSDNRVD